MEPLRVRVLGGLAVEGVSERELGSRKARTLLKILALARGGAVTPDRIADVLWGDAQPAKPSDQVAVLVSRLRKVLGAGRITRSDAGYALIADWLDVDELEARVAEAAGALREGRLGAARAAADAARALARGELLPDEDGPWVEAERAAAHALARTATRLAASAAAASGDHATAGALAEQALAHDPCDEASLRIVMRAHVAAGRPASALAAYARARETLAAELGVSPAPETEALHDAIVLGRAGGSPPPRQPRLVGRAPELAALDDALTRVRNTAASVVVRIDGEAGIGKTTLVRSWLSSLDAGVLVLAGQCDELGRDLPLQPIADALAAHVATLPAGERAALADRGLAPVAALLGLDVAETPPPATVVVDAVAGQAGLFAALTMLIRRIAAGRPVVLTVDDAHLATSSTLAWLRFAARRTPSLLVVATARPASAPVVDADVVLTLCPLDLDAVRELAGSERAAALHARSGGQPLLLTALLEGGGTPAASLTDAVERRVQALGAGADTLRTAAVLGPRVDLDLLAEVARAPAADLLGHLEAAARAGLLVEDAGFRFRHELERTTLERSVSTTRRVLVHRAAAQALAARPNADPLAVAVHARLGGDAVLAAEHYVAAGAAASAQFDLRAAEAHLTAALDLAPTAEAYLARALARTGLQHLDGAAEDAARAISRRGDAHALEIAGWVAYYRRRYDEAAAFATAALERAADATLRVSCLALAGRVLHGAGELAAARERLEEALALEAPPEVTGVAAVWLAQAHAHAGEPATALTVATRALVDADRFAHPFAPLHGRFARLLALGQLGRVDEARAACDDLDRAIAAGGVAGERFVGPAANCRAWLLRWTGLEDAASDHNRKAVESADPSGAFAEARYAALLDLTDGRLLAGDADGAADLLQQLAPIERWNGTMAWHQRHRWQLALARLALATGGAEEAASLSAMVAADARARGARRYAAFATAVEGLARRAQGAAVDLELLDTSVADLRACAALDGWPTIGALGRAFDVPAWRTTAARLAAAVVAAAPGRGAAEAFADRLLL